MVAFIVHYRSLYGVEPICSLLPIAPSTYYRCKAKEANSELRCPRYHRDELLKPEILRVWQENRRVYDIRKVWKQLQREGIQAARCTVARLMKILGIQGVRRGRSCVTIIPDEHAAKPLDLVNQNFVASRPNQLWVADITYVATWSGFVYREWYITRISAPRLRSSLAGQSALAKRGSL